MRGYVTRSGAILRRVGNGTGAGTGAAGAAGDPGQILVMAALLTLPLLLVVALAVDLGAASLRGQQLQSAADLAALAGAQANGEGADDAEVQARIDAVLLANDIDLGTVGRTTTVNADGDLTVGLDDPDPPQGLGLIPGGITVSRDATATTGACLGSCDQPIEFLPDLPPLGVTGSGDGANPLVVGDAERLMSLNHHLFRPLPGETTKQVTCVETATGAPCPGYPMQVDTSTPDSPRIIWYEGRNEMWYTMQKMAEDGSRTDVGFGCVDVERAISCAEVVAFSYAGGSPRAELSLFDLLRGWSSQIARVGDRLFLIGEDLYVACLDLKTKALCPQYPKRPAEWAYYAAYDKVGPTISGRKVRTQGDELAVGDRLYFTWPTLDKWYVFCWDASIGARCSDFGERIGLDGQAVTSRLFDIPYADPAQTAICAYGGASDIICNQRWGASFRGEYLSPGLPFKGTSNDPETCSDSYRCFGDVKREGSKLFVPSYFNDATYCVEIYTGQECGWLVGQNHLAYDYSKIPGRSCMVGLGHRSKFFTFSIRDMGPCTSDDIEIELRPCACRDGTVHWGQVTVDRDLLEPFDRFDVTVVDEFGVVQAGPVDLAAEGRIDLSAVDPSKERLFLRCSPVLKANAGWSTPIAGSVEVTSRAALVD